MAGKGLYANIHAKRKRGGKMRKKGAKGAPDFAPSQYIHSAEIHDSYTDPEVTFNNLYKQEEKK